MSQFRDEKDDSSTQTQKTLDRFFRKPDNSDVNGANSLSITNTTGGDSYYTSVMTKVDYLEHDARTDDSMDDQAFFLHEKNLFVPEGRSSDNYSNDVVSRNPLICDGMGRKELDDDSSSLKDTHTVKFDGYLTSSNATTSSSKPDQLFWINGYVCSLCGFELPAGFEEERQEHSDFHLAEMLQKEEAVDITGPISKERLAERPCCTTPTPKKKLKSTKQAKHIPIDAFFHKLNKNL